MAPRFGRFITEERGLVKHHIRAWWAPKQYGGCGEERENVCLCRERIPDFPWSSRPELSIVMTELTR